MSPANYPRAQHLRKMEDFARCTLKIIILFAFYIQDLKKTRKQFKAVDGEQR